MNGLPVGTVTFLFTDIEGSTTIAQRLLEGFDGVIGDHHEILRSAISSCDGTAVSTEGDSFFAVFETPGACIGAAIEAQRRIINHPWPPGGQVAVRMGAHTGEGRLGGDNYVGVDVIRAARIAAAAHGGQILISDSTHLLIGSSQGFEIRDLGSHQLKGLDEAEHIFQLLTPGMPSDFPPIATEGTPTNLPTQDSMFVGRAGEAQELEELLGEHRMVTITGPGGTGKTRLAIHVASDLIDRFSDGVFLVRLDAVEDPAQVGSTIANAIGGLPLPDAAESITTRIGSRKILLVLDNFEQVVTSAPLLTRLLENCSGLALIVTSQRLLRIRYEQRYPLTGLQLPEALDPASVLASDSAALFVRRAAVDDPSFVPTDPQAEAIGEIVRRLDGLPLAIEMAAARVRVFGLEGLRSEIRKNVASLSGGLADAPERHQSLMEAIGWSYGLLDESSKQLLRRAAVFEGGFSLEAVEAVCNGGELNSVASAIADLLDASLVASSVTAGSVRFKILEPIRSFGLARLTEAGEAEELGRRHAEFFTALADQASRSMDGPKKYRTLEELGLELGNLGAALDWSAENDPDLGLSALPTIVLCFQKLGVLNQAGAFAERLLGGDGSKGPKLSGLLAMAHIRYWLQDYSGAAIHYEEALTLAEELEDKPRLAETLYGLAYSFSFLERLEEASDIADRAYSTYEELSDETGMVLVRGAMSSVHWKSGDLESAARYLADAREHSKETGDVFTELTSTAALGGIFLAAGDPGKCLAASLYALGRFEDVGDESGMVHALDWMAVALVNIDAEAGVRLSSALHSIKKRVGGSVDMSGLGIDDIRTVASRTVTSDEIDRIWNESTDLTLSQAASLGHDAAKTAAIQPTEIDLESLLLVASRKGDLRP